MRDLVRISDEDVPELTGSQHLRMFLAFSIAVVCAVVSLQGVAVLFTEAELVPLPGMRQLGGQIAWGSALVAMLVAVTFLIRGVVKRRLQWAIAISLLIHFLLCLSVSVVEFHGLKPTAAKEAGRSTEIRDEFTLPDYAGEEVSDADSPWRQQTDPVTPDNDVDVERTQSEIAQAEKPQSQEPRNSQEIEKLEAQKRREEIQLAADAAAEIQRQATESDLPMTRPAEAPDVATAEIADPKLDARIEQDRQAVEAPTIEREQTEIAASDQTIGSAKMNARRSESVTDPEDVQANMNSRAAATGEAAASATENIEVATTAAQQLNARETQMEIARQSAAVASGASGEPAMSPSPASSVRPAVSRAVQNRAAGVGEPSNVAPAAGSSVAIARNGTAAGSSVAAATGAQSVDVAVAGGVGTPALSESSTASTNQRGTGAAMPVGSDVAGRSNVSGATTSDGAISATNIARNSGIGNRPNVGDASGSPSLVGRAEGRQASAVGTNIGGVEVANPGDSRSAAGEAMVAGPASTNVGRQASGLPASSGSSTAGGTSGGPASSGPSSIGSLRPSAISGAGRGTAPSALLNPDAGFAGGQGPAMARTRAAAADTGLSPGAAMAEQSGSLVFAGPQAAAPGGTSAASALTGPRIASVPRRSAGLPGSSGPSGNSVASSIAGTSKPGRVTVAAPKSGVGNDRPAMATSDAIAGLVKKSVASMGGSPEARVASSLSMRTSNARREAARTLGGSPESEDAVERGLVWLARQQHPDGHWSIDDFPGEKSPDAGIGSFHSDSAATGLALLAYLGAGYTHQSGTYQETVKRGMTWLLKGQKPDGDLFVDESEFVWFYSHGIASIALCEAYGLTRDVALRDPAQNALNFIVASQHPEFGGWRYRPRFESDTSVSGWQLMALKSGEMSGLNVPKEAYARVGKWLDSVQSATAAGQFSYHPSREASLAMTAEGLLMRQYLGAKRDDAQLIAGANHLRTRLPDFGQRDSYYWYYATQVMFHMQGEYWSDWNTSLRDTLVGTQSKDGPHSGSWDPTSPSPEKWSTAGGRHYLTCLNLLMLEVYYRHLPLYLELEK